MRALIVVYTAVIERITLFVWEKLGLDTEEDGPPKEYPRYCLFVRDGKPIDSDAVRGAWVRTMQE